MSGGQYATQTNVSSEGSRLEIERTLTRYGATDFAYGTSPRQANVAFRAENRLIRFTLTLPDLQEFTRTPERQIQRSAPAARKAHEQAVRQAWRALLLIVKAKLEAVASGIVTFEQEFLPYTVLPNGVTVYEQAAPAVEQAYLTGTVPPLLSIGGAS